MKLPTKKVLRELLDYDPKTGRFFWKRRKLRYFKAGVTAVKVEGWNTGYVGKEAFTAEQFGYRVGMLLYERVKAHHVAWKWMTGKKAAGLDHINGVRNDNRFSNLREASLLENQRNRRLNANNRSGFCGVCFAKDTGKWQAQIKVCGKMIYLGQFKHLEDAISARKKANVSHAFHENHGKGLNSDGSRVTA